MERHESQMILDTFEGVFFTLGQMAKYLPDESRAHLVTTLLLCTNDPACPHMTREAVKAITVRMQE